MPPHADKIILRARDRYNKITHVCVHAVPSFKRGQNVYTKRLPLAALIVDIITCKSRSSSFHCARDLTEFFKSTEMVTIDREDILNVVFIMSLTLYPSGKKVWTSSNPRKHKGYTWQDKNYERPEVNANVKRYALNHITQKLVEWNSDGTKLSSIRTQHKKTSSRCLNHIDTFHHRIIAITSATEML